MRANFLPIPNECCSRLHCFPSDTQSQLVSSLHLLHSCFYRFALAVQFSFDPLPSQEFNHHSTSMKSVNPNKPVSFMYILLILVGVYYAFLPNRSTNSSVFDFFTSEKVSDSDAFDLESFSKIPVLRGGRVKPIDSVARNTLLVMRNKRTALRVLSAEENSEFERISDLIKDDGIESLTTAEVDFHDYFSRRKMIMITHNGLPHKAAEISAIEWFSKVLFKPEESDELKTFLIDHDQVLGLMNKKWPKMESFSHIQNLNLILKTSRNLTKRPPAKKESFVIVLTETSSIYIARSCFTESLKSPSPPLYRHSLLKCQNSCKSTKSFSILNRIRI